MLPRITLRLSLCLLEIWIVDAFNYIRRQQIINIYMHFSEQESLLKNTLNLNCFYSLDIDSPEFQEVVDTFLKYLNEKDTAASYLIKFTKTYNGYFRRRMKNGFGYGSRDKARKLTLKEVKVL